MAQFDVYKNRDTSSAPAFPYWLDIQHTLHEGLHTRLVIPLSVPNSHAIQGLEPLVEVDGKALHAVIPEMVSLPLTILGKKVGNLSAYSSEIMNGVDFLITGF